MINVRLQDKTALAKDATERIIGRLTKKDFLLACDIFTCTMDLLLELLPPRWP